jgi:hypothetical protein
MAKIAKTNPDVEASLLHEMAQVERDAVLRGRYVPSAALAGKLIANAVRRYGAALVTLPCMLHARHIAQGGPPHSPQSSPLRAL